jgi:uncharacterized membrane protein
MELNPSVAVWVVLTVVVVPGVVVVAVVEEAFVFVFAFGFGLTFVLDDMSRYQSSPCSHRTVAAADNPKNVPTDAVNVVGMIHEFVVAVVLVVLGD